MIGNRLTATLLIAGGVLVSESLAHKVRVYNNTDLELEVRILHYERPEWYWPIGDIDAGDKSPIKDLKHGTRILVAKDAINENVVLMYDFVLDNFGRRIRLENSPTGEIVVEYADVPVSDDP